MLELIEVDRCLFMLFPSQLSFRRPRSLWPRSFELPVTRDLCFTWYRHTGKKGNRICLWTIKTGVQFIISTIANMIGFWLHSVDSFIGTIFGLHRYCDLHHYYHKSCTHASVSYAITTAEPTWPTTECENLFLRAAYVKDCLQFTVNLLTRLGILADGEVRTLKHKFDHIFSNKRYPCWLRIPAIQRRIKFRYPQSGREYHCKQETYARSKEIPGEW